MQRSRASVSPYNSLFINNPTIWLLWQSELLIVSLNEQQINRPCNSLSCIPMCTQFLAGVIEKTQNIEWLHRRFDYQSLVRQRPSPVTFRGSGDWAETHVGHELKFYRNGLNEHLTFSNRHKKFSISLVVLMKPDWNTIFISTTAKSHEKYWDLKDDTFVK